MEEGVNEGEREGKNRHNAKTKWKLLPHTFSSENYERVCNDSW